MIDPRLSQAPLCENYSDVVLEWSRKYKSSKTGCLGDSFFFGFMANKHPNEAKVSKTEPAK